MNEIDLTEQLLNKLNGLQKEYNPTNNPFILNFKHDQINKKLYVEIIQHTDIDVVILCNSLIFYNEFRGSIINDLYEELNKTLIKYLIFSPQKFKKSITTIYNLQPYE